MKKQALWFVSLTIFFLDVSAAVAMDQEVARGWDVRERERRPGFIDPL